MVLYTGATFFTVAACAAEVRSITLIWRVVLTNTGVDQEIRAVYLGVYELVYDLGE